MAGVPLGSGEAAFRRLERRLAVAVHAGAGWTGRIDAGAEVPHRDVVRCLDAVRAAGIDAVTFQGAPPGRSR
jgi:biopolymer transport protein ExbD